ncbi:GNAT family N-acetyltransferase [Pyxidicoccus sp. MSG2]|uniref:GNAT family N-acetyltransferase n=1 Tax=Pyxidicoccus sp. MSG2 TaxID=2996790 RepID=UPI00226EFD0A|nr:GNAT family N-acetyltransferase [Pyxidicoccus sp. MSG2]MCY1022489.1 GNAT family N-acetyltransferase [Pyxidicoccus sp. MSG2]
MQTHYFDTYPELTTERLRLRKPRLEDAGPLSRIYGHPETSRYIGFSATEGIEKTQQKLARDLETASRGEGFRWLLCERGDDTPIGSAGIFHWSQADRHAEVGYVLRFDQWGRGVMKEVMPTLLRFGFEEMRLHRIEARVDPRNAASLRVLTRSGFQREGLLRESLVEGAGFSDSVILSLLEGEWRATG